MATPVLRRTVLQAGAALVAPLALAGIWSQPGRAASTATVVAGPPVSGTLAAWVVVEPDLGAMVRLIQLDAASRPVREVAIVHLTLPETGASLHQVCQRAHEMAMEVVARSWKVSSAECVASPGRIAHKGLAYSVGYTLWADVG